MDTQQVKKVTELLENRGEGTAAELAERVEDALGEEGPESGRTESWEDVGTSNSCDNGLRYRTCYRVDHGDGTYSPPWCDPWECR